MNFSRLALIIILFALVSCGCSKSEPVSTVTPQASPASTPETTVTPDEFAAAALSYARHCATCHGGKGEGGTAEVEGKKLKVPPLASGHALSHSDPDFVKQISRGGDGMPAFADKLSATEINDLVRFIRRNLQGNAVMSARKSQAKGENPAAVRKVEPAVK